MKTFTIKEDFKVETWKRFYHTVQAETLEEAIQKVLDEDTECYDSEYLDGIDYFLSPEENGDEATQEMFCGGKLIYSNTKGYV